MAAFFCAGAGCPRRRCSVSRFCVSSPRLHCRNASKVVHSIDRSRLSLRQGFAIATREKGGSLLFAHSTTHIAHPPAHAPLEQLQARPRSIQARMTAMDDFAEASRALRRALDSSRPHTPRSPPRHAPFARVCYHLNPPFLHRDCHLAFGSFYSAQLLTLLYMAVGLYNTHSFEWPFLLKFLVQSIVFIYMFLNL